jgi:hypothetical protein
MIAIQSPDAPTSTSMDVSDDAIARLLSRMT